MEVFFRKYFWTANVLFIFLFGVLTARAANLFIESKLAPSPAAASGIKVANQAKAQELSAQLNLERLAKVTGLPLPEPEPDIKEPPPPDLNAAPVKTSLRVRLLGTLLAVISQWSIASIQDVSTQRTQTYMLGDKVQGAEILEIERTRVIILNNSRREYISNEPDGSGPVVAAYTPPARPGGPEHTSLGQGIRATGPDDYDVQRAEIDKMLSNLNEIAMQARIVPAFKDGVAQGFKLFSIRPDSFYSKIGIHNGDVIKRINGYEMNSPEKALEIYSKLRESSRVDIDIDRNGANVTKRYTIR